MHQPYDNSLGDNSLGKTIYGLFKGRGRSIFFSMIFWYGGVCAFGNEPGSQDLNESSSYASSYASPEISKTTSSSENAALETSHEDPSMVFENPVSAYDEASFKSSEIGSNEDEKSDELSSDASDEDNGYAYKNSMHPPLGGANFGETDMFNKSAMIQYI